MKTLALELKRNGAEETIDKNNQNNQHNKLKILLENTCTRISVGD